MESGDPSTQVPAPDGGLVGKTISRYRIDEWIGAGGMGEVYKAWDNLLHRSVAIKCLKPGLHPDHKQWSRVLEEARAAGCLSHRGIVSIHDVLEIDGTVYLIQELVEGTPLREKLGRPFELQTFLTFAEECLDALTSAWSKGIIHCDLKPENIFLTEDGRPRILDFGIARHLAPWPPSSSPNGASGDAAEKSSAAIGDGPTQPAVRLSFRGSPAYLAPEIIAEASPDARSDVFSLGLIFYEMLSGEHPFRKERLGATLVAVARDPVSSLRKKNPDVPEILDRLILRMLEKNPAERPAPESLHERFHTLRKRPAGAGAGLLPWRMRLTAAILVAFSVVFIGLWATRRNRGGAGASSPHPPPCLVVEPFRSLSQDPRDISFAAGLTETVRARLARQPGILVASASTDPGAGLVLEGTIQRASELIRITCNLVDRKRHLTLTGSQVEGNTKDLFALQDQVTGAVGRALAQRFHLGSPPKPDRRPTLDVTAYDYYLQARGYMQRPGDGKQIEIAIDLLKKARLQDPDFTLAVAGLAEAYARMYDSTKDPLWAAQAKEAALDALAGNPDLAEVHASLGTVYRMTGDFPLAAREFRRAVEIEPENRSAQFGLAHSYEDQGECDAAERAFRESILSRPEDWMGHHELGHFYYRQGRLEDALRSFLKVTELTPDNAPAFSNLGVCYQCLGRGDEAVRSYRHSLELKPDYRTYTNLAALYLEREAYEDAAKTYRQALALDARDHRVWGSLGTVYGLVPGKEAAADSAYQQAIRLAEGESAVNPNDASLLSLLAQYYAFTKQVPAAERAIRRALVIAPHRPDVLAYVAGARELMGDRAGALEAVRLATRAGYPADQWERHPGIRSLVADPEFKQAVQAAKVGL